MVVVVERVGEIWEVWDGGEREGGEEERNGGVKKVGGEESIVKWWCLLFLFFSFDVMGCSVIVWGSLEKRVLIYRWWGDY